MNPALSVIFFTTLSGAGYGMLMCLGVLLVIQYFAGYSSPSWSVAVWATALVGASALIAIGLASSMAHLGKPGRAWRAFSQWRTSWLSREGVMSLSTYVPVLVLLIPIATTLRKSGSFTALQRPWLPLTAAATTVCASITVICTAMIYASLSTIPAWRHRLVVPGYMAFALLSGWALVLALGGSSWHDDAMVRISAAALIAIASMTILLKVAYWRAIDRQVLPTTRGDAVGLPGREISVFERPHTEESYITREMAFAVARKHARHLRAIALLLFGGIPVVVAAAAWLAPAAAGIAFAVGALSILAGAFVERWLFFAEARHVVTLYYTSATDR